MIRRTLCVYKSLLTSSSQKKRISSESKHSLNHLLSGETDILQQEKGISCQKLPVLLVMFLPVCLLAFDPRYRTQNHSLHHSFDSHANSLSIIYSSGDSCACFRINMLSLWTPRSSLLRSSRKCVTVSNSYKHSLSPVDPGSEDKDRKVQVSAH